MTTRTSAWIRRVGIESQHARSACGIVPDRHKQASRAKLTHTLPTGPLPAGVGRLIWSQWFRPWLHKLLISERGTRPGVDNTVPAPNRAASCCLCLLSARMQGKRVGRRRYSSACSMRRWADKLSVSHSVSPPVAAAAAAAAASISAPARTPIVQHTQSPTLVISTLPPAFHPHPGYPADICDSNLTTPQDQKKRGPSPQTSAARVVSARDRRFRCQHRATLVLAQSRL